METEILKDLGLIDNEIKVSITDSVDPIIQIVSPNASFNLFAHIAPNFTVRITDPFLDTMWYTINGGVITTFTKNNSLDQFLWDNLENGTAIIRFYANDTSENENWDEIIVNRDILAPIITINNPIPNQLFGSNAPLDSDFNVSIIDGNLEASWYQLKNLTYISPLCPWIGSIEQGVWDEVGNGSVIFRVFANDSLGHEDISSATSIRKALLNNQSIFNYIPPYTQQVLINTQKHYLNDYFDYLNHQNYFY